MTEEQIEKEAADYVRSTAVNQFDLTKAQAKFESWKAGYHFRDKEIEELKDELRRLKRRYNVPPSDGLGGIR